jgi:hypothetical protein
VLPVNVSTESVPLPANQGVSRPLAALLRWWLQRQVTQAQTLQVSIQGASQVWLSGCLPYVQVRAQNIIYQNLHLHQVAITAEHIQFHWPFLQRQGQPLVEPNHSLPYLQATLRPYLQELHAEMTDIQGVRIYPDGIDWLLPEQKQLLTQVHLVAPNELMLCAGPTRQVRIGLGTDVQIRECQLQPGSVYLAGDVLIRPGAPTG